MCSKVSSIEQANIQDNNIQDTNKRTFKKQTIKYAQDLVQAANSHAIPNQDAHVCQEAAFQSMRRRFHSCHQVPESKVEL